MKDLVITQKIFSKEECEKILELPSKLITEDSKEAIEQKKKYSKNYGNYPAKILNNDTWVRERMETYLSIINEKYFNTQYKGLVDYISIKEYNVNDGFDWHTDVLNDNRRLGVTIPLSLDCEGGEFELYDIDLQKQKSISPKLNTCILFATNNKTYHGVNKVISGYRKLLSLWYYTKEPTKDLSEQPHRTLWVK